MQEPQIFDVGALLAGRYEVVSTIGTGAMGWVLHVIDRGLGDKSIALKILYPHLVQDKTSFARFQNEVLIARDLNHPNVVKVFDIGQTDANLYFISMEYIHGSSLKDLIYNNAGQGMRLPDAARILHQISEGIGYAHRQGIIHRDLKPDNVLVSKLGEVKVADFGIARSLWQDHGLTKTGGAVGTPYYMSPEQIRGEEELDARADIYSLGIMAFELVAGRRPFDEATFFQLAQRHFEEEVPDLATSTSGIPLWYHELVKRCCAKDREQRFSSAEEIAELLLEHMPEQSRAQLAPIRRRQPLRERMPDPAVLTPIVRGAKRSLGGVFTAWGVSAILAFLVALGFIRSNPTIRAQTVWPLLAFELWSGFELTPLKELFNVRITSSEHRQLLSAARGQDLFDCIMGGVENEGDKFAIRLMMLAGMDPNFRNDAGQTPLEFAIAHSKHKAVGELLRYKANPNAKTANGEPLLTWALQTRADNFARQLIQAGASLTARDRSGNTPLHVAAEQGDAKIVRLMLNKEDAEGKKTDPALRNSRGQTALAYMLLEPDWSPDVADLLLGAGTPLDAVGTGADDLLELVSGNRRQLLEGIFRRRLANRS